VRWPCPTLRAMPRPGKGGRYHHGDLRAALVDTAIEVIGERGVRGFSLAEASRRLGVAVSAPYAHFTDRDDLLAAVAVHAYELFYTEVAGGLSQSRPPADRLAAMARSYVRFAAANRPLFEVLYEAGLDKARHPEIEAAERPLADAFMACVRALSDGDEASSGPGAGGGAPAAPGGDALAGSGGGAPATPGGGAPATPSGDALADDLASALEATALGHVMLFLDGGPGQDGEAVELAADRAARATLALIASRHLLGRPAVPQQHGGSARSQHADPPC
jgi:AcrR family transcriptional regulator